MTSADSYSQTTPAHDFLTLCIHDTDELFVFTLATFFMLSYKGGLPRNSQSIQTMTEQNLALSLAGILTVDSSEKQ